MAAFNGRGSYLQITGSILDDVPRTNIIGKCAFWPRSTSTECIFADGHPGIFLAV